MIRSAAMRAEHLAGHQIGMRTQILAVLYVFAPACKNFIGPIPQFLTDDRRNGFLILSDDPILLGQHHKLFVEQIHRPHLAPNKVSLILGILDDLRHRHMVDSVALSVTIALIKKHLLDLIHAVTICSIHLINRPHNRRFFLIYNQLSILFTIAPHVVKAKHRTTLNCLL